MRRTGGGVSQAPASAVILVCLALMSSAAYADENDWIGTSGNWSDAVNWSLTWLPGAGDNVYLTQSDGTDRVVTLNLNVWPDLALGGLTIECDTRGNDDAPATVVVVPHVIQRE